MKGFQRKPISSSCHCSGVARSDSKPSAKALYGKFVEAFLYSWLFSKNVPSHTLSLYLYLHLLLDVESQHVVDC